MTWNPYKKWNRIHASSQAEIDNMCYLFEQDQPKIVGFDTETTGLHIKRDKAFLMVFGWVSGNSGRVFTLDCTRQNIELCFNLAKKSKMFIAWNTSYDLHMLKNTVDLEYDGDNLVEGTVIARLCTEAIPHTAGGDSLALKSIGQKYVHWQAADSEQLIKQELRKLNDERVKVLTAALKQFDHPTVQDHKPIRKDTGKPTTSKYAEQNPDNVDWKWIPKKWNKGLIEDFLKDLVNDVDDLPQDVREVWKTWQEEYPEPTYADVDRELMIQYAGEDVITMLEYVRKAIPVLTDRDQWGTLKRESRLIPVIYRMERVGFKLNRKYLEESRVHLLEYIKKQREEMYAIARERINVGQKPSIIRIFKERWGIDIPSSNKPILKKLINGEDIPKEARRYAKLIKELRTLEKWYTTYCTRLLEMSEYDGRLYTQIFQAGAVSGRVGSDFQQFPKDSISDENGNELFHPRKAIMPTDVGKSEGYTTKWYCDLSQIELRVQANYTLLVSGGDTNLCRAYFPFKCRHGITGEWFDYKTDEGRSRWNEKQPSGKSIWYVPETRKPWEPVDVHGETTTKAFPQIEIGTEEFKKWRSKGKIFNFLSNYGGGKGAAIEQLDLKEEEADALVKGYNESFPGVREYQNAVINRHRQQGYVTNMYGRRYYLKDNNSAYKLANYLIQGSCADDLKRAMIEVDEFLKGYKSRLVMCIHDELIIELWKGEEHIIPQILRIISDVKWSLVPIVCDAEYTATTWYEKEEVEFNGQ